MSRPQTNNIFKWIFENEISKTVEAIFHDFHFAFRESWCDITYDISQNTVVRKLYAEYTMFFKMNLWKWNFEKCINHFHDFHLAFLEKLMVHNTLPEILLSENCMLSTSMNKLIKYLYQTLSTLLTCQSALEVLSNSSSPQGQLSARISNLKFEWVFQFVDFKIQ